ncbi:NADH-quinone oxidoreductase subunit G [Rhodoblastus acidophilus]|uniref:NADH-quinone oxidoreductase subunit NuoG n=1 Tax=Rhodoblastus acidophilus TaxID=1074 RepID=UPI0022259C97|nr:NADH-quinone oxidoreductase subunit NuoG [Rhodoblastus acidophilus]MCW2285719.1 NADH-quinone oxidoreductase subunit G [Rhodoblastus acidophilus]MCW2333091.1 NADH-quinone oxidoreductase subunit G [Rhodoblastus acidophilus]
MAKIIVDGIEVDVPAEYTLLQAAETAGKEIPRFCFHERLSVAGNCRMCLVEVKGGPPKPTASCAMSVKDLRPGPNGEPPEMFTNSPMVKKAREGVMEFLLINHPLDCPICDQGGECDLQDQALAFGRDRSRYTENKNAVENKYIGPLVKTEMTRCIQCTRCVRFTAEICGTSDMGNIGRGEDSEITTYLQSAMRSELQGNVTDLCPVGALLPRPQNFRARPWEYTKTPGVDVSDALGANIRIDTRGREVIRILPRINDAVNEEWISDKARQSVDGLKLQRLDRPYLRENGRLRPASWSEAFGAIAAKVQATSPDKTGFIGGDLSSVEDLFAAKALADKLGVKNIDARQDGAKLDPKNGRASYLFNASVEGIDAADALLIIGSNPRWESPVLNARIRRRWRAGDFHIAVIGEPHDLTYPYEHLGAGPDALAKVARGEGFGEVLAKAERPLILVGAGALAREDGAAIAALAAKLAVKGDWNGYSVLHTAASRVGALDIGFVPGEGGLTAAAMAKAGALDLLFLVGADEINVEPGAFVVYVGTHGDRGAHRADVILPGAAYTEKSGLYVNTEGRVQLTDRAGFPPGDAREDWAVFRALSAVLGKTLPFDSLAQLRALLNKAVPHMAQIDEIEKADAGALTKLPAGALSGAAFVSPITDFYLTNPIARASKVMAECSALAKGALKQAAE